MSRCRCRGLVATRLLALASKTSRADIWSFAYGGEHNVLLRHGCSIEKSVVRDVTIECLCQHVSAKKIG